MMAAFTLEIVTPDRLVYQGEAEKLIVRATTGDLCVLAHHIDYATALAPGEATVTTTEGERGAACSGGLLSVNNNHVRLMATTFEWADEIDLARAQRAQEAAEAQLKTMSADDQNYVMVEAKLKRALARIHAKG